jgi:hypothetical protein
MGESVFVHAYGMVGVGKTFLIVECFTVRFICGMIKMLEITKLEHSGPLKMWPQHFYTDPPGR